MAIKFDELDEVYYPPNFEIRKGLQLYLSVNLNGNLREFDDSPLGTKQILNSWCYFNDGGKEIKPFKLLNYVADENNFTAELMIMKKNEKYDELKLLLQDLIDIYNIEGIRVKKCEVKIAN